MTTGPHHSKQERGLSSDGEQDSPQETVSAQHEEAGPSGIPIGERSQLSMRKLDRHDSPGREWCLEIAAGPPSFVVLKPRRVTPVERAGHTGATEQLHPAGAAHHQRRQARHGWASRAWSC